MSLIDSKPAYVEELSHRAYIAGDIEKSELLATIAELLAIAEENEDLVKEHAQLVEKQKLFEAYQSFFDECFQRLALHYPCPSVTSGYDCNVIYDIIEKSETEAN